MQRAARGINELRQVVGAGPEPLFESHLLIESGMGSPDKHKRV